MFAALSQPSPALAGRAHPRLPLALRPPARCVGERPQAGRPRGQQRLFAALFLERAPSPPPLRCREGAQREPLDRQSRRIDAISDALWALCVASSIASRRPARAAGLDRVCASVKFTISIRSHPLKVHEKVLGRLPPLPPRSRLPTPYVAEDLTDPAIKARRDPSLKRDPDSDLSSEST